MVDQRARELVEDDQLTAPRRDREAAPAEHAVDLVAGEPRGVHKPASRERTGRSLHSKAALAQARDAGDRGGAAQLAAGQHRLGGEGQWSGERADERLAGHLQGAARARPQVRLAAGELGGADLLHHVIAVGARALGNPGELGELLVVPRHEQRARALDGDPHARRVLRQQLVPARDEAGLERAGL